VYYEEASELQLKGGEGIILELISWKKFMEKL